MAWAARPVTPAPWFAFLVHPRSTVDLLQGLGRFVRQHCADDDELVAKVASLPPTVVGQVRFGFAPIFGELVCIPRLPAEWGSGPALEWVAEAVEVAAARGARVIGLGALTSTSTGGGLRLLDRLPPSVTITNGNAYTAVVVRDNALEAGRTVCPWRTPTVAVVGATGSVGGLLSRLLADADVDLILVGRTVSRVHRMLPDLVNRATATADLTALRDADVVVTATHDAAARVQPDHLRPPSVVIDCAQPANVTGDVRKALAETGVPVVRGGLVRIGGFHSTYDFGNEQPGLAFACLTETYLFAQDGLRDHSVGRPTLDLAKRLELAARRHGLVTPPIVARPPVDAGVESSGPPLLVD